MSDGGRPAPPPDVLVTKRIVALNSYGGMAEVLEAGDWNLDCHGLVRDHFRRLGRPVAAEEWRRGGWQRWLVKDSDGTGRGA